MDVGGRSAVSSLFWLSNVLLSWWHLKPAKPFQMYRLNNLLHATEPAAIVLIVRPVRFTHRISAQPPTFTWLSQKHHSFAAVAKAVSRTQPSHLAFFPVPRLPYLDYAAGWLSQLFCMQVALAWFLCGGEREERGRGRGGEIVPRILRENYSFSWRWGVGKTTLPCSINCCLRETDILRGGGGGGGVWDLLRTFWKEKGSSF